VLEPKGLEHQRHLPCGCFDDLLDIALQLRRLEVAGVDDDGAVAQQAQQLALLFDIELQCLALVRLGARRQRVAPAVSEKRLIRVLLSASRKIMRGISPCFSGDAAGQAAEAGPGAACIHGNGHFLVLMVSLSSTKDCSSSGAGCRRSSSQHPPAHAAQRICPIRTCR
jgi:hypothetical protein